jgi:hypothetical protein
MTFPQSIFNNISELKSRRLTSIEGLVLHPTTGLPDFTHPIEISFELEGIILSIRGASDGESIEVAYGKIQKFSQIDMDDLGKTKIDTLSQNEPYNKCVGYVLEKLSILENRLSFNISGINFDFSGGSSLCVVNLGDDLWTFDHIPDYILADFIFTESF